MEQKMMKQKQKSFCTIGGIAANMTPRFLSGN